MKILIDMNLAPAWVEVFARHGWDAVHWSAVGDKEAADEVITDWALTHGYVVFTHDLDFGDILAATRGRGPSVLLVRSQDVLPSHLESLVVETLREHKVKLETGALVVVDEARSRIRILPISK